MSYINIPPRSECCLYRIGTCMYIHVVSQPKGGRNQLDLGREKQLITTIDTCFAPPPLPLPKCGREYKCKWKIHKNTYKYMQTHYIPHRYSVPRTGIATLELESEPGWSSGISRKRRTNVPSRSWPGKDTAHSARHHSLRRYSNQPQPCTDIMYAEARLRGASQLQRSGSRWESC